MTPLASPGVAGVANEGVGGLLRAADVSFGYGRMPVVMNLDLHVEPGEVVALLGPNGAGKTTTLLGLAGELTPMSGTLVRLDSLEGGSLHTWARRGLAYVPEERSVITGLTVNDNLRLGRGSVDAALEIAPELRPLLRRRAGLLSGGEQQILSLVRALASQPRLLLADELSLGLAPLIVERLLSAVREAADGGVGVVLVEQHVRSALAVADRAYVLRRGRIIMQGTVAEIRERSGELEANYLAPTGSQPPQ